MRNLKKSYYFLLVLREVLNRVETEEEIRIDLKMAVKKHVADYWDYGIAVNTGTRAEGGSKKVEYNYYRSMLDFIQRNNLEDLKIKVANAIKEMK